MSSGATEFLSDLPIFPYSLENLVIAEVELPVALGHVVGGHVTLRVSV